MTKLPPWTGDDRAMLHWLGDMFDDYYAARLHEAARDPASSEEVQQISEKIKQEIYGPEGPPTGDYADEIAAALHGDLGPIRARLPELDRAGMLCLPTMKHGETHLAIKKRRARWFPNLSIADARPEVAALQETSIDDRAMAAASEVKLIREFWQRHFKKKNRKEGETSAEQFAARRWEVSEENVKQAGKRMG